MSCDALQKDKKEIIVSKALSRSNPAVFKEMKEDWSIRNKRWSIMKRSTNRSKQGFAGHRQESVFYLIAMEKPLKPLLYRE